MKKRSVLLIIAVVAIFGVIGGAAAVASADHGDAGGSSAFIDRVAELLGLAPEDVSSAIAREKQLKGWRRSKKIALVESFNPRWKDLSMEWYQ